MVLDRDLEVVEIVLLEQRGFPDRGLDEGLGRGAAVLLQQARIERAGVHADTQRDAVIGGRLADVLHLVIELTDVARVHAHSATPGLDCLEHVLRFEVNVRDHRDAGLLGDNRQRVRVLIRRASDANDVAAGSRQLGDLLERRANVVRLRRRHGLDGDLSAAAHRNVAHHDATRLLARERRRRDFGHTKIDFTHRVIIAHSGLPSHTDHERVVRVAFRGRCVTCRRSAERHRLHDVGDD